MAWFEAHQTLARHPKTLRLARELKKDRRYTVGLLFDLFSWALDTANASGELRGVEAEDIAMALGFSGKAGRSVVEALLTAGYLEIRGDGQYAVHDWYDYSGSYKETQEHIREKNKERQQKWRDRQRDKGVTEAQQTVTHNDNVTRDVTVTRNGNNGATIQDNTRQENTREYIKHNPSLKNERNNINQDNNSCFLSEKEKVKSVFDYSDAPIPGVPDKELPGVRIRLQDGDHVPESMIKVARQTYRRDADKRGETIP